MGEDVGRAWGRVVEWLAAHAPASYTTLRPPAVVADIEACERALGVELPAGLRQLLLINDGAADFDSSEVYCPGAAFLPGGHRLLSAAEIVQDSRNTTEIAAELDDDMAGWWWHPQWVMFGRHIAADGLAIDQRPGPEQGYVGEFMHEDHTSFDLAPSIEAFIVSVAESLESGSDFSYFRPVVEDGRLDWDVIVP
jgi:cell wall assembly regulator SMI1